MKPPRLPVSLCLLTGLLLGSTALGQQDPRTVVITTSTPPKASGAKPRATARTEPPTPKRYWADYKGNAIRRSNLDGSSVETVAGEVKGPYGISQDPETGQLLWTSSGDEVVQSSPPDAAAKPVPLTSSFEEYFAITVNDPERNVAYGVDGGQVIRITQDRNTGAEQREVLLQLSSPDAVHGLALSPDQKSLYLGDSVGRMSQKLNLSDLKVVPLVYSDGEPPVESAPKSASRPASQEKTR